MNGESSEFYCVFCGKKGIPVFRKAGQGREAGHLKKLYCLNCNRETNHAEVRPYGKYNLSDFYKEFTWGNFDDEGNRKRPWKQFCAGVNKIINTFEDYYGEEEEEEDDT